MHRASVRVAHCGRAVVLSPANRMSGPHDFSAVVRGGARAGSATVVAHVLPPSANTAATAVQIGFIVNKSVGNAVIRNRVRRRLRHLCRPLAAQLPPATRVVVRALPPAASAQAHQLGADLESSIRRAARKAEQAVVVA